MKTCLININTRLEYLDDVKQLYLNSFPIEERRPWDDIEYMINVPHEKYFMWVVIEDCQFAGFIAWWELERFRYVEHFAVAKSMRRNGIGSRAIRRFCCADSTPVVLEVELPNRGEIACRRIEFYERNGFVSQCEFNYVQPAYEKGLPEVSLMLMVENNEGNKINLEKIASQIHRYVYKKG